MSPPGRGQREEWLAALGDDGGAQGDARALAARQLVGRSGNQNELLRALGERNAGVAGDHGRQPGAGGRGGEHDAVFIDGVDAGGVAGHQSVVDLGARDIHLGGMLAALSIDHAGQEVHGRRVPDLLAAFSGIGFGQQNVRWNVVELRIAVVGVAIGVGQFQSFGNGVNILRRN